MSYGEKMSVVDLFCGCGGLSKGFEDAGFEILAAFDCWQPALTCYNHNFNHQAHCLNLDNVNESIKVIQPYKPQIIIGGPPCQEFSNAGKRQEGELADLTYKYAQIIVAIRPQYFVMENVPRVKASKAYTKARELYKKNNYGLTEVVLDASRCGVPQKRNRFFCIGSLNERDGFLTERIFTQYTGTPISVLDYFVNHHLDLNIEAYYRHPTTYSRRAIFSVNEVAPTIRGVNRPRPATYRRHEKDAVDADNVVNISQLTTQQRAFIQTFSEEFTFDNLGISKGDLDQLIGNAVPVLLAKFIADRLLEYIRGRNLSMDNRQAFSEWLRIEKGYSDRSISDVFSRIKRAQAILPDREINRYFIVDLERMQEFQSLSTSVKSQIKKAITLKATYMEQNNNKE